MLTCAYVGLIYLLILVFFFFFTHLNVLFSILYAVFCNSLFYKILMSVNLWIVYSTTAAVSFLFFIFMSCTVICVCGSLVGPPHFINHLKSRLWNQPLQKTRPMWNLQTFITDSVGGKRHGVLHLNMLNQSWEY